MSGRITWVDVLVTAQYNFTKQQGCGHVLDSYYGAKHPFLLRGNWRQSNNLFSLPDFRQGRISLIEAKGVSL